jgi:putative ATP-binding cassette transporter
VVIPLIVVSPRYFARQIGLGGLMQVANAFAYVHNSLSFIINAYAIIANWIAVTQRLSSFTEQLHESRKSTQVRKEISIGGCAAGITVENLDLDLPNGASLLRGVTFKVEPGGSLLITGPASAGKSVLLRAMSGIWPFGSGRIQIGKGRQLFVPQLPYSPLGTLAEALLYPLGEANLVSRDRLVAVLDEVGLDALVDQLDSEDLSRHQSQAQQQQLAFARILLAEPAVVFLDDATSALDERLEARLYGLLRAGAWRPTIVSASYKSALFDFHDKVLDISDYYPQTNAPLIPSGSLAIQG